MSNDRDEGALEGHRALLDHLSELLRSHLAGRRWIVATEALARQTKLVERLHHYGAEAVLCVAGTRGTGPVPDPELAPDPIVLDVAGETFMASVRKVLATFRNPPPQLVTAIDAFDPDGDGVAIGAVFHDGDQVAGRPVFGARPVAWQRLEDKTVIDALWTALGVPTAPHRIVPVDPASLADAHRALDVGLGTVLVADNREGFHGGAEYLRWIRTADDLTAAAEFFATCADVVRAMPFLEGIPCSIHGLVSPGGHVGAFRPCEMMVLRRADASKLQYGSAATFWDPPAADRAEMQATARRVGEHLRDALDYRGFFTIDGIMSADGFRPTELNPRMGGATGYLSAGLDLDLGLLNRLMVSGEAEDADWRPEAFEAMLLENADGNRAGRGILLVDHVLEEQSFGLAGGGEGPGGLRRVDSESDEAAVRVSIGDGPTGSFIGLELVADRVTIGEPAAPWVARAAAFLDAEVDARIGAIEAARDVRR